MNILKITKLLLSLSLLLMIILSMASWPNKIYASCLYCESAAVISIDKLTLSTTHQKTNNTLNSAISLDYGIFTNANISVGAPYSEGQSLNMINLGIKYQILSLATEKISILAVASWQFNTINTQCLNYVNNTCLDYSAGIAYDRKIKEWTYHISAKFGMHSDNFEKFMNIGISKRIKAIDAGIEIGREYALISDHEIIDWFIAPVLHYKSELDIMIGWMIPVQDKNTTIKLTIKYPF